jgi:integrase
MSHTTVTLSQPIPMPRHTHLMQRGRRFYLNVRVPKDLRPILKKENIRKSLGTSDHAAAVQGVLLASLKQHTEFAELRAKLRAAKSDVPQNIERLSDDDAYRLMVKFLIQEERQSEEWWEAEGRKMPEMEQFDAADALKTDAAALQHDEWDDWDDGSSYLEKFLHEQHLTCPTDSKAYRKLLPLIRRAKAENLCRTIDVIEGRMRAPSEPMFSRIFANTQMPKTRRIVSLGNAINRYTEKLKQAKRKPGTLRTYSVPMRLLRELLGAHTAMSSIAREDVENLFQVLVRLPKNAAQRYPALTLREAITQADKDGNEERLGGKVLANYFNNISGFFNFAVSQGLMPQNPASDRYLRAAFEVREQEDAPLFSIDELNRLFRAPLYKGCKDDGTGYAKVGPNRPRRGRFWVPLVGLFHGLRLNEAGQLETADVKEENGIMYLYVRESSDDAAPTQKSIKTAQSKRRVPVHPEMFKLGFREFVQARRQDRAEPRLFPELTRSKSGYVSDSFGKWFKRFIKNAVGPECRATFKSFRHQFRSALFDADVSIPVTEALGGWELVRRSAEKNYLNPKTLLSRLHQDIAKVKYSGLDLSHLYIR